jgi:uncharacterized heparinase superfamily protein
MPCIEIKLSKINLPLLFIEKNLSYEGNNNFIFLNKKEEVKSFGIENNQSKLWNFNLNYFDFINSNSLSINKDASRKLILKWIKETSNHDDNAWHSYPLSLRITNWVKWLIINEKNTDIEIYKSLAEQTNHLSRNIEWDIMGNHLIANAKGLIFSGILFDSSIANKWFNQGKKLLTDQLDEQILDDGGHFERSPMYHSIILEDILDLILILKSSTKYQEDSLIPLLKQYASRMAFWLKNMSHPDGNISFFNDCAFDISTSPNRIFTFMDKLNIEIYDKKEKINIMKQSGYISFDSNACKSILDVGLIGPDYIPAHAHADTLSFELSLFSERIIINAGISNYDNSHQRNHERSTRSSSTVEVDQNNSSDVWSTFRVAKRAYPYDLKIQKNKSSTSISCKHNGYANLFNNIFHKRTWVFRENELIVEDFVNKDDVESVARFLIHNDVNVFDKGNSILLSTNNGREIKLKVQTGEYYFTHMDAAFNFNKLEKIKVLNIILKDGISSISFKW